MANFYVLKWKKLLWNVLIIVVIILALIFVFKDDRGADPSEVVDVDAEWNSDQFLSVETVTVRPIPTKFAEYKLERERSRSRQTELLQNIAYDSHSDSKQRGQAQDELQNLIDKMSRETEIENLLKAKGYVDALAIINHHVVTVVVPVTLSQEEAARIGELVQRLSNVGLDKITIVDETFGV